VRRLRRAKIVATLGPASSNSDMIGRLFKAGTDVFRINMSHTSQDRMRELVGMIRAVERDSGPEAPPWYLHRRICCGENRR